MRSADSMGGGTEELARREALRSAAPARDTMVATASANAQRARPYPGFLSIATPPRAAPSWPRPLQRREGMPPPAPIRGIGRSRFSSPALRYRVLSHMSSLGPKSD